MRRLKLFPVFFELLSLLVFPAGAIAATGADLIQSNCLGCHIPDGEGRLSHIANQRKTPEGWLMTITRMQVIHQLNINALDSADPVPEMVKHLADTQGLAPAETQPYRYLLERRLNTIEQLEDERFAGVCSRCHTGARAALQRRNEEEWTRLIHFHLGQYPSIEYSAGGRDREWFTFALNEVVPWLSENFPLESPAWNDWREAAKPVQTGAWRIIGTMPGKGEFAGYIEAEETAKDRYAVKFRGEFDSGEALQGAGDALVYTGYEWRASLSLGDGEYRQVLAGSADGATMRGRMYLLDHEETGMDLTATRIAGSRLLAVVPNRIRAGTSARVRLSGFGLEGGITADAGLKVISISEQATDGAVVEIQADAGAAPGARMIKVGGSAMSPALTVYPAIDYIKVLPEVAIARVGGNGGSQTPVNAAFEAWGWSHGADGAANTEDDLPIGVFPATWSVRAWDEAAEKADDVRYAGVIDPATGVFTSAAAGPNPDRPGGVNNFGNLAVVAEVKDGETTVRGEAHLMVTVQRWNNPPLR